MDKEKYGNKIEHGIWYNSHTDTYYVRGQGGKTYSFPTLEDAKSFYSETNRQRLQAKLERSKAEARKRETASLMEEKPYPYNAIEALGVRGKVTEGEFLNEFAPSMEERDLNLFVLYFEERKTMAEIAECTGLNNRQRVQQILSRAMHRLKDKIEMAYARSNAFADPAETEKRRAGQLEGMEISSLGLSTRAKNALSKHGISTVGQLSALSIDDLSSIDGMGSHSVKEIDAALHGIGVALKR